MPKENVYFAERRGVETAGKESLRRVGEGKKQRYDNSSMRYFMEKIYSFPLSIERQLRDFSNSFTNRSTFVGRILPEGYMLFAANKAITVWKFDPNLEYGLTPAVRNACDCVIE